MFTIKPKQIKNTKLLTCPLSTLREPHPPPRSVTWEPLLEFAVITALTLHYIHNYRLYDPNGVKGGCA